MKLTYSGEQKTYALNEIVKITKGTGENNELLAVTDLNKDDVVRLEFDEDGALISIQLWDMPININGEAPASQS